MARPKSKNELLSQANEQYNKLLELINSIKDKTKTFNFNIDNEKEAHWKRDKNMRDVLIHLYEWHNLLIIWINSNLKGDNKSFLPEPYNWKTYGEMNVEFWKKHQNTPYEEALNLLENSHKEVIKIIENISDKELFTKGFFTWTGTTTLGSYCISTTSSHYDWAIKKIKKYKKDLANI